jgi:hypothetical protein
MVTKSHNTNNYIVTEYLNKNIYIVENVFDNETCTKLVSEIQNFECKKLYITEGNNVECYKVENVDNTNIHSYFVHKIKNILDEVSPLLNVPINGITNIEIRKVYGETRLHSDGTCPDTTMHPTRNHNVKLIRSLTIVGCLNDNFEGGEYYFPNQDVKVKLKPGSFILFPPYWTHPHSVSKVINTNDYRYIVSTWALDNGFIKYNDDNINNIIVL